MPHVNSIIFTEHHEAMWLAQWLQMLQNQKRIELFCHVPNETYTKSWSQKRKNTQEGVKSGVPDYIIITPKQVIFLELKRVKNSHTTPEQKLWLEKLKDKHTDTYLAKGFEAAKVFIESKLAIDGVLE